MQLMCLCWQGQAQPCSVHSLVPPPLFLCTLPTVLYICRGGFAACIYSGSPQASDYLGEAAAHPANAFSGRCLISTIGVNFGVPAGASGDHLEASRQQEQEGKGQAEWVRHAVCVNDLVPASTVQKADACTDAPGLVALVAVLAAGLCLHSMASSSYASLTFCQLPLCRAEGQTVSAWMLAVLPQLHSLSSASAATLLLQSLHDSQPASRLQAAARLLHSLPLQQQALPSQQQELAVLAIKAFAPAALAEAAAAPPQDGSLSLQQLLRQLLDLTGAAQAVPAGTSAGSMPPVSIRCAAVQQMGPELFELLEEAAQAQLLLVSTMHLPAPGPFWPNAWWSGPMPGSDHHPARGLLPTWLMPNPSSQRSDVRADV